MDNSIANSCPNTLPGVSTHVFLTLINVLTQSKCQINSPQHYPDDYGPNLKDNEEFDFIVIGGGSGGSIVANKISENQKWSVLVLEAGKLPSLTTEIPAFFLSLQKTEEDWQYYTEVDNSSCLGWKDRRCSWPRGKCLGGSSSINYHLYFRGNKRDYDRWTELGNSGWDYDSVFKQFKELENLQDEEGPYSSQYGKGGDLPLSTYHYDPPIKKAIIEAGNLLGYPMVLPEQELGYFTSVQTIDKGVRANAAKIFLGKVKERQNLKVAMNTFVEKLQFSGNKVNGVEVNINNKKIVLKARKEVILSAGAINTPQILMLSGIGPQKHLEKLGLPVVKNLPVGANLQDHVNFLGFNVAVKETSTTKLNFLDESYQYFMYQKGVLGQMGISNLIEMINSRNDSNYPNLQIVNLLVPQNCQYLLPELIRTSGYKDEIATALTEADKKSPILIIFLVLLNPKSRGNIRLRSSDPRDKPLIYANYFQNPDDLEVLLEGIKYLTRQFKTKPLEEYDPRLVDLHIPGCEKHKFESDDYWRCAIRSMSSTLYHPVGTCKMGPKSDPTTVVDDKLKVHGIDNLRVVDASIMPLITSGNTNAPTLMIGRKGGLMIVEEWKNK